MTTHQSHRLVTLAPCAPCFVVKSTAKTIRNRFRVAFRLEPPHKCGSSHRTGDASSDEKSTPIGVLCRWRRVDKKDANAQGSLYRVRHRHDHRPFFSSVRLCLMKSLFSSFRSFRREKTEVKIVNVTPAYTVMECTTMTL